ncbi:universal stress protein [Accumulibacter sp.]|uniref:universal stress protein n=1 Tax=Accumulibacter sp. TaxID=2053492 RepID=UPI0028C4B38E|nr:universal stress protein [Accumulibacter sp.]
MNLLVGVDFSDSAKKVLAQAALLARALGAKIWLLHVAEPDPEFVGYKGDPTVMRDDAVEKYHPKHRQLQTTSQTLRDDGLDCAARLVQGATVETVLHHCETPLHLAPTR